jgi:hypothetical protein
VIISAAARGYLANEARALLTRLEAIRPFASTVPMVAAAAVGNQSLRAIEGFLATGRRVLRDHVQRYLGWLRGPGCRAPVEAMQRRLTFLRLEFNTALDQLDIFADAITQRSEHEHGLWLAGLDAIAADALVLADPYFTPPPLITYLDRGHGAAIRRARTRLPGGGESPVALIRVPRERMVGGGIGASLIHEVGHQAAALLDLNDSLRLVLQRRESRAGADAPAWRLWRRWISEIVADVWALGHLGASGTMGLLSVVSLPRAFVFRMKIDDPHPFPWIRVMLSCRLGRLLFPDPQWGRIEAFWESAYPRDRLSPAQHRLLGLLEATAPEFERMLLEHRPRSLRGRVLAEIMPVRERGVPRLRRLFEVWRARPEAMCEARPTLVVAVLGQARFDGRIDVREEASTLTRLLTRWAIERAITKDGAPLECHHWNIRQAAA